MTKNSPTIAGLKCPSCGESGSLMLRIEDGVLICGDCDEEFDRDQIEATAASWNQLLLWLKSSTGAGHPLAD